MSVPSPKLASKLAYIPADIAYDGAKSILKALQIERGPTDFGEQGDHSSAFALLKKVLSQQIRLSNNNDRLHVTPVFEALYNMTNTELAIYTSFIKETDVLKQLKEIRAKFTPLQKTKEEKSISELKPDISEISVDEFEKLVDDITEAIQKIPLEERDPETLKKFFSLSGKVIPYINLTELQEKLVGTVQKAKEFRAKVEENATKYAQKVVKNKKTEENKEEFEKLKEVALNGYIAGAYEYSYAHGMLTSLADIFAQYLNKLPFATFIKVKGVSGKNEQGGTHVSKAIKELRSTKFDESMTKEEKDKVIYNMGKLLDYFPIDEENKKEINKNMHESFLKKGPFKNKAVYSLLTRNNDPSIFAHVVTRHLRLMRIAFPKFDNACNDELRIDFIKSIFKR